MTTQELNRDIKRLAKAIEAIPEESKDNFISDYATKEFKRLYHADSSFECINLNSLKIMLRLNLRYRFVQLHQFGLHIELKELL